MTRKTRWPRMPRAPAECARPRTPDGAASPASLVDLLRLRATTQGESRAYTFLENGEAPGPSLTWAALDRRARAIAAVVGTHIAPGARALLVYPPGLEFIAGFFGCLYAGVIAVPVAPPHGRPGRAATSRLTSILDDATPGVVLSTPELIARWAPGAADHQAAPPWIATEDILDDKARAWPHPVGLGPDDIALLQYTSGSTAEPRGVIVTHGNLLHNLADARALGGEDAHGPSVSWLPVTHDMGLVDGVLQPLWSAAPASLMAPAAFLQRPVRWLQAIARTGAVRSGGPNFAYDLCVRRVTGAERARLDLSSWRAAYSGAEPVRADTLRAFANAFAASGFDPRALRPCYGLAEATLVVTSGRWQGADVPAGGGVQTSTSVPCGRPAASTTIRIVDPRTSRAAARGAAGEIWVAGPAVAQGYWNRPGDTRRTFHARIDSEAGRYLRTGDLGLLVDDELVVTGRLKDLLIVRGHKHFPQDLEHTAERSDALIRPGSAAACAGGADASGDRIVMVAEIDADGIADASRLASVIDAVRLAVVEQHGVQLAGVALVGPRSVPRTTSGKLRRFACLPSLADGSMRVLGAWGDVPAAEAPVVSA